GTVGEDVQEGLSGGHVVAVAGGDAFPDVAGRVICRKIKAARSRAAGPVPAAGLALGGPPAAHRATLISGGMIRMAIGTVPGRTRLPRSRLSSSRPPRAG